MKLKFPYSFFFVIKQKAIATLKKAEVFVL